MLEESLVIIKERFSKKDYSFLCFALCICVLPLSINISTFLFIASLSLKVLQVLFNKDALFATYAVKVSAIIGLVLFLYIEINAIAQTSFSVHFSQFEKLYMHYALFFLTPILFQNRSKNKLLVYAFFLGIFSSVLYVFFYVVVNQMTFDKHAFTNLLDIHHTYLSMFILTFVNYSIVQKIIRSQSTSIGMKALYVVLCLASLGVMYLLDSKVSMLIFLLLFLVHSFPELSKKNAWYYVLSLILILVVISAFNNKVGVNYERALDFRLQIWEVSFNVFENNPVFGDLSLPEKDILNYNHYLNGKYYYVDSDLNSHNQYLSILMRFGFVGIFLLFLYVVNCFRRINPNTQKLDVRELFGFLIISLIVCYIENIFDRHHGIVYITIFYNYYLIAIENAEA